jgi:hypothetical protein
LEYELPRGTSHVSPCAVPRPAAASSAGQGRLSAPPICPFSMPGGRFFRRSSVKSTTPGTM